MATYQGKIAARVDQDTEERLEALADRYKMTASQLMRLMIKHGIAEIEANGLDQFTDPDVNPEVADA